MTTQIPQMPKRAQKFFTTLIQDDIVASGMWEYGDGSSMTADARSFAHWVRTVQEIAEAEKAHDSVT